MMLARENGDRSTGSDNVDLFSTKQRKNIQKILKHIQKYSKIFGNSQKYSEILKNIQKYSKIFRNTQKYSIGQLDQTMDHFSTGQMKPRSLSVLHHRLTSEQFITRKEEEVWPEKWFSSIFYVNISLCSLPKLEYYNFTIFKRKNILDIFLSLALILNKKSMLQILKK